MFCTGDRSVWPPGRFLRYTGAASSGVTLIGGFYGYYANTGLQEIYPSSTCYVDGITCEAKNARFGGIVIEALTAQPSEDDER